MKEKTAGLPEPLQGPNEDEFAAIGDVMSWDEILVLNDLGSDSDSSDSVSSRP